MEIKKYEELKEEFVPVLEELLVKVQGFPETKEELGEITTALAEFAKCMVNFSVGVCILHEADKPDQIAETVDYDKDVEQLTMKEGR